MAGDLKVGVIGLGLGRRFLDALAANPFVGSILVCDPDADRRRQASAAIDAVEAGFEELEDLLTAGGPDAVCVVTPDHLHRPHTTACLEAGCHVLQTKPLATNLEDARAIVRAADASDRVVMVAHERRFRPNYRLLRDRIASGVLGEVVTLRVDAIQDKRGQFANSPWYASAEAGRTALVGSGIHEVDLTRFMVGKPIEQVTAFSNRLGPLEFPKDKTTAALFAFDGGAVGQVTVTYEAHPAKGPRPEDHFRLIGTKGMAYGDRVGTDGGDWEMLPEGGIGDGVTGSVNAFVASVVDGAPVEVTPRDAFDSLAAAAAADRAAATSVVQTPEKVENH